MKKADIVKGLDDEFSDLMEELESNLSIQQRLQTKRFERIRVNKWIDRLREPVGNDPSWKRNRNLYVKLLVSQLKQEYSLEHPFDSCPKFPGLLPMLPKHLAMYTRDEYYIKRVRKVPKNVREVIIFEDTAAKPLGISSLLGTP